MIDVRQPLGNANTLFFDERGYAGDPTAVVAVLFGPQMSAIYGRGGFQYVGQLGRQARVAGFLSRAGEFVAILKVAELVLQQDKFVT